MRRSLAALGFALLLSACNVVTGSGTLATDSREVTAFSKISVADAISAVASVGPTTVRVTADDNVLEFVDVAVVDGTLKIGVRDTAWVQPSKAIEVRIYSPELVGVEASGAAKVVAQAPQGERFDLVASGASQIEVSGLDCATVSANGSGASSLVVSGAIDSLELVLSGASTGCLSQLASASASVNLSGASTAQIVALGSLAGSLSGASSLQVAGEPAERSVDVSGESRVEYR